MITPSVLSPWQPHIHTSKMAGREGEDIVDSHPKLALPIMVTIQPLPPLHVHDGDGGDVKGKRITDYRGICDRHGVGLTL